MPTPLPGTVADDRPVVLLDVDGVINAPHPLWPGPVVSRTVPLGPREYRLTWAAELVAALNLVHAQGDVEFRWATTWVTAVERMQRAVGFPAPGLPPVACAFTPADLAAEGPSPAKLYAALGVLEQGRRLVWADDDAVPPPGTREHATLVAHDALLLTPDPYLGLTPDHLDRLEAFADRGDRALGAASA